MTVREARAGDEDAIFALVQQLGHAFAPDRAAFDATMGAYLAGEQPTVLLYVVEDDDGVRGYALTTVVPLLLRTHRASW